MASAPWTRKKGVSWVAALGVVLKLQSTEGNSSTQACLAFSRGANSLFFIPLHIKAFAFSTCLFVLGCATDANFNLIPILSQWLLNSLDVKFVPLSVMMLCGTPKRNTMDLMKLIAAVES
jgi:hypothetical protein